METAVSIGVLAALLYLITRPPRPWPEVVWAVPAAALVLVTGLEPWSAAGQQVRALWPTLAFLAAIFVVAEGADAAGLFDAAGSLLGRGRLRGRAAQRRTVVAVAVLAVVITSVLSLDATVVLFTPVVVRAVRGRGRPTVDAALLATVFLANGASLLSPVANLTNLLVIHQSGLSYAGFSARLALPCLVAGALITWAVLAGNREPIEPVPVTASGPPEAPARTVDALGWFVVAVIAVLVVAFFVGSGLGIAPAWPAWIGALVISVAVVGSARDTPVRLARAAAPGFLVFVLCLAIVVGAAARHGLGHTIVDHVPHGSGLLAMLGMALLAAALANLVNNLPATLLLLPALAGRPVSLLLAALLGLNIGPNLTYTGSLATLLWRRRVREDGVEPALRTFLRSSWVSTPLALAAATVALWLTTGGP
jgi:arsenical pump membrane protein